MAGLPEPFAKGQRKHENLSSLCHSRQTSVTFLSFSFAQHLHEKNVTLRKTLLCYSQNAQVGMNTMS